MQVKKIVEEEIRQYRLLHAFTQAYGEIASMRMRATRESVLKSRVFMESLDKIFQEVLASYIQKVKKLVKEKNNGKITFLAHNGRVVVVYLSSNTGLYGSVLSDAFKMFLDEVRKSDVEAVVVGRYGASRFSKEEPDRPFTYFEFPDIGVDQEKLAELVKHLVQYEEIRVFFPKFQSVVAQAAVKLDISAQPKIKEGVEVVKYLFEPSLEKILKFFESEIFASVFEQTIKESQLAKFASRMLAMDLAGERIEKAIDSAKLENLKAMHRAANKKQLGALAGRRMWGR